MDAHNRRRRSAGRGLLTFALAAACLGSVGCGTFWDDVTRRDFSFNRLFAHPDPLVVLRDSQDPDDRARAMRALREPLQYGGDQHDQDVVVSVLTTAATSDRQIVCRLAAVSALRHFKDPRAVEGLKEAYYRAGNVNPETATILRCQALDALGATGQPGAVELLVKVVKEPPVEGATEDKQAKMDERIAAARAGPLQGVPGHRGPGRRAADRSGRGPAQPSHGIAAHYHRQGAARGLRGVGGLPEQAGGPRRRRQGELLGRVDQPGGVVAEVTRTGY